MPQFRKRFCAKCACAELQHLLGAGKGEWTYQHLMSVNGCFKDIQRADLLAVANRFSVPHAKQIIEEVKSAISRWSEFAEEAGVPLDKQSKIAVDFVNL